MTCKPRLLDLFSGAGGCSVGYERAGFDVTGVDHLLQKHYRGGTFIRADALEYVAAHGREFDVIHASPPCQAHSSLRALWPGKVYPDLIPTTRAALVASGKPYVIENVPGAPLGGGGTYLLMLCGTMFGLVTPRGDAEIRRHRLFETNRWLGLQPACQHGGATLCVVGGSPEDRRGPRQENVRSTKTRRRESLSVSGTGMGIGNRAAWARRCRHCGHALGRHVDDPRDPRGACESCSCAQFMVETERQDNQRYMKSRKVLCVAGGKAMTGGMMTPQGTLKRRAMSVTGNTPQTNTVRNTERETFSADDARTAMGIDWMPMKALSQAIPPAYTEWIGNRLRALMEDARLAPYRLPTAYTCPCDWSGLRHQDCCATRNPRHVWMRNRRSESRMPGSAAR